MCTCVPGELVSQWLTCAYFFLTVGGLYMCLSEAAGDTGLGLFMGDVGLFMGDVGLFMRDVGLSTADIGGPVRLI